MKKLNKILIIAFANLLLTFWVTNLIAQCSNPNVVWSDEFSGNTLDLTKWNYQTGDGCAEGICGWGNNELQSYQEANVVVSNGTLQITAKKERIRGSRYTSGRINSKNKGDFSYGRFEALIKLPAGDGLWPAFWMLSTNEPYGGWPQSGEIDIMEFTASKPDEIFGTIHYGDLYPGNQFQGNDFTLSNGTFPEAFHEFAIEWEPGEIRWFMDGILYSTKTISDVSPYNWPFDNNDFHFLLNVAVGGNLGGPVNDNALPATMEVDYVRVYDGFKPYIAGERVVLNQSQNQSYRIGNLPNNTNVTWTVPNGATIVGGQGTDEVFIDFGNTGGIISASFDAGCGTQVLNIDVTVEPPYVKSFAFENFDEPATATFSSTTGTLTEVSNPNPNTVNSSALSGEYVRNSAEQFDLLVYNVSNIPNADAYVQKDKKFYVDVYTSAPIGTEILLQLESDQASPTNYPTGRHSRYIATTTQQNGWERLIFTLLDQPDPGTPATSVNTMILLFASNTFTGDTYYFDNLDSYEVDQGGGSNTPPSVTITQPSDGASFTQGTNITIAADASDPDGSVTQVEFFANGVSLGTDNTSPYSISWTVPLGSVTLTAEATDNEAASTLSTGVSVTGTSAGDPTSMHVASIITGTASAGQGNKYGTATVTIVDDLGNPVSNAAVSGTFSGTYNESAFGNTDNNGNITLQTQGTAKGGVTVVFCVDNVTHGTLSYDPASNVLSCSNESSALMSRSLTKENIARSDKESNVVLYPNPAGDLLYLKTQGFGNAIQATVMDATGKTLLIQNIRNNPARVDISSLPKGLFILRVQDEMNNVEVSRFLK